MLSDLAFGYTRTPEGMMERPIHIDSSASYSAAGIYSTADDIFRFDQALYGDRLLTADLRHQMMTVQAAAYGFGWNVESWTLPGGGTLPVVSHTGSVPGYQSYYLRSESNRDCVIILDNFWQGGLVVAMGRDLMEVLNGKPIALAKRSLDELLTPIAYGKGTAAMIAAFEGLGARQADYDLGESALNALGYKFLRKTRTADAIAVFEWNVRLHPKSPNLHDSLGEAYRAAGRRLDALRSYQAALSLDPQSKSAAVAVKELSLPE